MFKAIFWDVDHGSATYIETKTKKFIIDLGAGSYINSDFSPLLHLKDKYKVKELDAVIITHPHRDHLDDIHNLKHFRVQSFIRPAHLSESDIINGNKSSDLNIIQKYLDINKRYLNRFNNAVKFLEIPIENGRIQIYSPKTCSTSNLNNHSLVIVISYLGVTILIPGDNERVSWLELLKIQDFRKAINNTNIFVAPHHGRKSGVCEELFDFISPCLTIVSDDSYVETSASSYYSRKSTGHTVKYRDGESEKRKCIATRTNGVIKVQIGKVSNTNTVKMFVIAD